MSKMKYYKMFKWLKRQEEGIISLKIETAKKKQVRCRSKSKISIIILNVNSLKMPIKRERLSK